MINFKVGIMGAGKIAGVIADTLKDLDANSSHWFGSPSGLIWIRVMTSLRLMPMER